LLDGFCRTEKLVERIKSLGQPAIAVTDHGAMYGAVGFFKAAKAAGVKPIIGCEVYVAPRSRFDREHGVDNNYFHLVLLCKNETGYKNLSYIVSRSFTEGFYIKPRIDLELLYGHCEGLIALSACIAGQIPQLILSGRYDAAKAHSLEMLSHFGHGNYYLELQNHGLESQLRVNSALERISRETGIPLVATNDAHYVNASDADAQDVLMCIQTQTTVDEPKRMRLEPFGEYYIKTESQMLELFPDHPEAIANSVKIAEMCNFEFEFGKYHFPEFELPIGESDAPSYLRKLCLEGLTARYGDSAQLYTERLDYELSVIGSMGFTDYFLIVGDFISYAKRNGIAVGPGRGSAPGSIVAYCLGITGIDPMRYELLFERFLNPERVSMPDIDIDFCVNRRGEVIDYVAAKYGKDRVVQIATFGTLAARAAIRDVARALGFTYAEADEAAKQIPSTLNVKLADALRLSQPLGELYGKDDRFKRLFDTAVALEGMPRHSSTHAAGVVITKLPAYEYLPLATNDDIVITQYTMTTIEELGLLKMDFLGLRNLTVMEDAVALIRRTEPEFSLGAIPEDAPEVYEMLNSGKTVGVFQIESQGMTGVCVGMKAVNLADLASVISLYRPGPMDSIPRFLDGRHHPERIRYTHPSLEPILGSTNGCIIYQEQVIEIFRTLGGFSTGQADMIRRAMSKKKQKEILANRESFVHGDPSRNIPGAISNGIPEQVAGEIYDEIIDFAFYAFNKPHAFCYAMISYQTAYLKRFYPREYMAALLSSVLGFTPKLAEYVAECKEMRVELLPPDVNESNDGFTIADGGIRFGLAAVKNVGHGFIHSVERERRDGGRFTSFENFCYRLVGTDFNKRAAESLIKSGAFDRLGGNRRQLLIMLDKIVDSVSIERKSSLAGQLDLFGILDESPQELPLPDVAEFPLGDLLTMEREVAGLYLSGHPMDEYRTAVREAGAVALGKIAASFDSESPTHEIADGDAVLTAGIVMTVRSKMTKNNTLMNYVTIEDDTGDIELLVFARALNEWGGAIRVGEALYARGRVSRRDEKAPQIVVDSLHAITAPPKVLKPRPRSYAPERYTEPPASYAASPQVLYVRLSGEECGAYEHVKHILGRFPGHSDMRIHFENTKRTLGTKCVIAPALLNELTSLLGESNVVVK
jgi:DNA polymerase-3 subunit alpha